MPRQQRGFGDLVSRTLDSVVNGVSQQPPTVRLESQCEEQINLHSKVSVGASRRPPSEFVATLHTSSLPASGYKSHIRNRDANTQHLVLISDGAIRVWNLLTGVEASVYSPNIDEYLSENTGARTDEGTAAGNATANDMNLLPAANVTSGSWFGDENQFEEIVLTVGTIGVGTYTVAWEYSTGAGTWTSLTVTDGTAHFKTTGKNSITFTAPDDWALATYDGYERYWVRARYVSGTVTTNPLGTRARIGPKKYLNTTGTDASQAFAITSVADFSFVANKERVVAMSGNVSDPRRSEFLIHCQESWQPSATTYNWRHKLGSDDPTVALLNNTGNDTPGSMVDRLIAAVYIGANGYDVAAGQWVFTDLNTVMHGKYGTGSFPAVNVPVYEYSDAIYAFIGAQTQRFSDLPPKAPDDFTTEITGGDGNEDNNYWVKFDESSGTWVETVGPELDNNFDAHTMPWILVQTSVGGGAGGEDEFSFAPAGYDVAAPTLWAARLVGDADTAPEPGFVGKTITDIVFHKNRLGFVVGESIILSEAGEYFNFWPTTVTTLVDSDPIETAGTNNRVGTLDFALPFNEQLYAFSATGGFQNVLRAAGNATVGLTAANAEIVEASAFPVSALAKPVAVGKSIFYTVDRDTATSVYEYALGDGGPDAAELTSHIPTYIPANVKVLSASPQENLLVALSDDQTDRLFVYSFFYLGGQKVQNSWSHWLFDDSYDIQYAEFVGSDLYIAVKRASGLHLEKLDLTALTDGNLSHRVYLDSMETLLGVYTVADNKTKWTPTASMDEAVYGDFRAVLSATAHGTALGQVLELTWDTNHLWAYGDHSAGTAIVGRVTPFTYEFTKPILKLPGRSAGADVAVTQGRLQISKWKLLVRESGGFQVNVSSEEVNPEEITFTEDTYVYTYPGKIVSAGTVDVDNPRPSDEFLFDVGMEGKHAKIEVTGSSHLPFTLIGAEWEGQYSTRSQRI